MLINKVNTVTILMTVFRIMMTDTPLDINPKKEIFCALFKLVDRTKKRNPIIYKSYQCLHFMQFLFEFGPRPILT